MKARALFSVQLAVLGLALALGTVAWHVHILALVTGAL